MNLKLKVTLVLLLFMSVSFYAQNTFKMKGTVVAKSDSLGLPGVTIRVLKTSRGGVTDFEGNFEIEVKKGETVEFSYLGFTTQTVLIADQKSLRIVLAEGSNLLDEIVVVGYGTQKKSLVTGSISKVVNEKLDQIAVSRVDEALIGQVSGVNIRNSEGEAGGAPTIRIRGVGSITSNSGPLVVLDGAVVDSDFLTNLDMNNVESFEVLKDAASSAIYGSRGANGVILITTKQGKEGKAKFTYNTFGKFSCTLMMFLNNFYKQTHFYIFSFSEIYILVKLFHAVSVFTITALKLFNKLILK